MRGERNVEGVRSSSCSQGGLRPPIRWFHGRKQLSYPCAEHRARSSLLARNLARMSIRGLGGISGVPSLSGESWHCRSKSAILSFSFFRRWNNRTCEETTPQVLPQRNSGVAAIESNDS